MNTLKRFWWMGAAILFLGLFLHHHYRRPTMAEALVGDRAILHDSQKSAADPVQTARALARLGQADDPLSISEARRRSRDPDPLVRRSCALNLGRHYEGVANRQAVALLVTDRDGGVRMGAIEGLGMSPGGAAAAELKSLLEKKTLTLRERLQAYESIFNVSEKPFPADHVISDLLNEFQARPDASLLEPMLNFLKRRSLTSVKLKNFLITLSRSSDKNSQALAKRYGTTGG